MENFETLAMIGLAVSVATMLFIVFFIFKALRFFRVSVKLCEELINLQEASIAVQVDIRDKTRSFATARDAGKTSLYDFSNEAENTEPESGGD